MSPAEILGLDATAATDPSEVKKAYARLLKQHRPDRDPEGFRRIRDAYEALTMPTRADGSGALTAPAPTAISASATPSEAPLPPPVAPVTATARPPPPAGAGRTQRPSQQPIRLLQTGDWNELCRMAEERLEVSSPKAPRTDLDLARCLALVEPEQAFQLAQRAFEADHNAVDPWMEAMLAAGMELSAFPLADRRSAATAALDALPSGDDPETAKRLRMMACQVAHAGLRTTLTAAAVKLDSTGFRKQAGELTQRRAEEELRTRRRQFLGGMALLGVAGFVLGIISYYRSRPAADPAPVAPAPVTAIAPVPPNAPGDRRGIPTPDNVAEHIHLRVRDALEKGNIPLAVSAFKPLARQSKIADSIQVDALHRVLEDVSIGLDQRIQFGRKLDQTARPILQQVIAEVLPEAIDPATPRSGQ